MLQVTENKVEFYYDIKDPFIKGCMEIAPEMVEKIIVQTDLHYIFEAITDKYGLAECADLVQKAMELTSESYKKDA